MKNRESLDLSQALDLFVQMLVEKRENIVIYPGHGSLTKVKGERVNF